MKKILSLVLAGLMVIAMIPTAFAEDVPAEQGTRVEYVADADVNGDGISDAEAYTVTVPAQLAPGGAGNVAASGTWNSKRQLVVSAQSSVTLANSINSADTKVLNVTFPGITLVGSNTVAVSDTKEISVADISDALFGTWSGTFNYTVEMQDVPAA